MFIPKWLNVWLVVSSLVVLYDASYVLLRPASMVGGHLFRFFSAYDLYIKYDTLYGHLTDSFVVIQSWLNLVEVSLILAAVGLSLSSCPIKKLVSALVILTSSAFVFWKTVIYVLYSHDFTTDAVKNLTPDALLVFVIPSSLWIIFPLLAIFTVIKNVTAYVKTLSNASKAKSQ
jgi:hypothetical protein